MSAYKVIFAVIFNQILMTNREIISEVVGDLRALQVDDRISERYVLAKLKMVNALLLKRENEQFRLYDDNNVWFPIECLQMEYVPAKSVPDGKSSIVINKDVGFSRSLYPIPQLYSTKTGPLIREIQTMDDVGSYQPTTPLEYRRILNREFKNPNIRYFWFDGQNRLVIPNSTTEVVAMTASFVEPWKAKMIDSCACPVRVASSVVSNPACPDDIVYSDSEPCPEPLDDPFLCPTHLLSTVKEMASKDLYDFYKRNITDPVPDNDNNSKTDKK